MLASAPGHRVACVVVALLVAPAVVPGQDSTTATDTPSVLVLVGGTLVEGTMTESATGFIVELPRGRYVVPFARVLLTAHSRREAYEKQRKTMRPPSPAKHVALAHWCLRYGMNEEGKTELRSALQLAGNYEPARELLTNIERLERGIAARNDQPEPTPAKTEDGYDESDAVSIAGLSPETAGTFVNRVQPLLVNGCGNARCHGGATDNGFHLERVRFGRAGNRTLTQRNLAAAIRHVDRRTASASPLLTRPSGTHGGTRRPVFDGPAGRAQRELLAAWIEAVAEELGVPETATFTAREETANPVQPAAATRPADPPRMRREPDLLDRILDEERPDAFDPDAFNRGER